MDLNRVMIMGNVTQDPRISTTPSGKTVASFSIATNRVWKSADGIKQSEVEFHNVTAWGKLAEIVSQYCHKGKKVLIEGRLKTDEWQAQDGSKRRTTKIIASNLILLGSRDQQSAPGDYQSSGQNFQSTQDVAQAQAQTATTNAPQIDESIDEINIDDIPI